jgi:hypothetical protein
MEAKQRRLQADVDAGLISPAKMATDLGHYPSVDAAVKKGVSDELKKKAAPPPMFGFGAAPPAVDPLADPPKPEPDDEEEDVDDDAAVDEVNP